MKKRAEYTGILNRARLDFKDNSDLERYYEEKYQQGGYEEGCIRFGVNISAWYHSERHRSALKFLNPRAGERILDAGCGKGELAAEIVRCSDAEVHAVDVAGAAFDARYATLPRLHFAKMNVERLSFTAGYFDQIVSVETLEHLLHPLIALGEFHRVLKPGGRLVITYPTINQTKMQQFQRRLGVGRILEISEHLNEWSYDELIANSAVAGFKFSRGEGLVFDFGVLGAIKLIAKPVAVGVTKLALAIRSFPRNSAFVSLVFTKQSASL